MIQNVEKLRPELQARTLRNLLEGEVLVNGEIQVEQRRTDNAIAAGIAQQVPTIDSSAGSSCRGLWKRVEIARRGKRSRQRRKGEATIIDVAQENTARIALVVVIHRIASRNAIRNGE